MKGWLKEWGAQTRFDFRVRADSQVRKPMIVVELTRDNPYLDKQLAVNDCVGVGYTADVLSSHHMSAAV